MSPAVLRALAAFSLLALIGGCNSKPMTVRPTAPTVKQGAKKAAPVPAFCRLDIARIDDLRMDPTTLGAVGNRPVRAPEDSMAWIRNQLLGLNSRGVAVRFGNAPVGPPLPALQAQVELSSAWLSSMATSKTTTVVMNFNYQRDGKTIAAATYRGNDTGVNWNGSDSVLQGALDTAFGQVLDQARLDVKRLCVAAPAAAKPASK